MLFSRTKVTASSSNNPNPPNSSARSPEFLLNKLHPCPQQHECHRKSDDMENHIDLTEIIPPYDSSKSNTYRPSSGTLSYTQQFVDKIRDTTSKLGYQDHSRSIVDRKSLYQGMKLVLIAVEEFESGNETIGLDVYLCGLNKIIMALPHFNDPKTNEPLKEKLFSMMEKIGIHVQPKVYQEQRKYDHIDPGDNVGNQTSSLDNVFSKLSYISQLMIPSYLMTLINHDNNNNDDHTSCTESCESSNSLLKFKKLTRATTDMAICCIVLFKQSPIPGLLYIAFSYFMHLILWLEHQFNIVETVQDFGMECIKFVLIVEEKYRLHEYASEALYSTVSVLLRTIVAYKDTPSFSNINN